MDDFHVSRQTTLAANRVSSHLNPHDGQIGLGEFDIYIFGRIIKIGTSASRTHQHQYNKKYQLSNHRPHTSDKFNQKISFYRHQETTKDSHACYIRITTE